MRIFLLRAEKAMRMNMRFIAILVGVIEIVPKGIEWIIKELVNNREHPD